MPIPSSPGWFEDYALNLINLGVSFWNLFCSIDFFGLSTCQNYISNITVDLYSGKTRNPLPFFFLSRLHPQHRAQCGAWTHDPEIDTWAEIKSWIPNWLNHPGNHALSLIQNTLQQIHTFCHGFPLPCRNCSSCITLKPIVCKHTSLGLLGVSAPIKTNWIQS